MNSLVIFRFPLKDGHDPKRFMGCDAVAIVGSPEGGLGGGVGGNGSGSLGGSMSIGSPLFSLKGSGELGDPGLSTFIGSPCPDKDNPV